MSEETIDEKTLNVDKTNLTEHEEPKDQVENSKSSETSNVGKAESKEPGNQDEAILVESKEPESKEVESKEPDNQGEAILVESKESESQDKAILVESNETLNTDSEDANLSEQVDKNNTHVEEAAKDELDTEAIKSDVAESVKADTVQEQSDAQQNQITSTEKSDVAESVKTDTVQEESDTQQNQATVAVEDQNGKSQSGEKASDTNVESFAGSQIDVKDPVKTGVKQAAFGTYKDSSSKQPAFGAYKDSSSKQPAFGTYKDASSKFGNKTIQNSRTQHSNKVSNQEKLLNSSESIQIVRPVVNYEWQRLNTSKLPSKDSILASFEFRAPRYLSVDIGNMEFKIRPTEYLIAYSNGFTAIGMLKNQKDIQQNPITVQFGHWSLQNTIKLCVGSTVLVRSYLDIVKPKCNRFVPNSNKKFVENDYFRDGVIFANVIAANWTVTNKPELTRSLGTVKSFSTWHKDDGDFYKGEVYDCEYNTKVEVADDLWEYKMKKEPELDNTVVLTWAEVSEQHVTCKSREGVIQMLPSYALKEFGVGKNQQEKYWLVGVGTCYPQN